MHTGSIRGPAGVQGPVQEGWECGEALQGGVKGAETAPGSTAEVLRLHDKLYFSRAPIAYSLVIPRTCQVSTSARCWGHVTVALSHLMRGSGAADPLVSEAPAEGWGLQGRADFLPGPEDTFVIPVHHPSLYSDNSI